MRTEDKPRRWLNQTVLGIGLASLFSDWSHEIATTVLPMFLASMGAAAGWLGLIEGVSDGLSSFAKMSSGYFTDRLERRKPVAVWGYLVTTLGTGAIGLATAAWHILVARSVAWLGRGIRTPVRKTLLAASVDPHAYGRAFGFERMMDTLGAILGPASALLLLKLAHGSYTALFTLTLIPGLAATGVMAFVVKEKKCFDRQHVSFSKSLGSLPRPFRSFLMAVWLFGMGDFAHTMLILLATQRLTASVGAVRAASVAAGLYVLHNVLYAGLSFIAGMMADHFDKRRLLSGGYLLGGIMALLIIVLPPTVPMLVIIFALGGTYVAIEETLEDSLCAELVGESQQGMAFGTLATVNGIGDFASSITVGLLWTAFGTTIAFGYTAILFFAGASLVNRVNPAGSSVTRS